MDARLTEHYTEITRTFSVSCAPDLPWAYSRDGRTWRVHMVEIKFSAIAPESPSFAWVKATGRRVLKNGSVGIESHDERWSHLSREMPDWLADMVQTMAAQIGGVIE